MVDKFRDGFWVHKRNKKWVFSKKPSLEDNFEHLSVQQLKMLVDHEIKNGFFLLGENLVMRQKKGISIGGHLSSALAIMLANYAEHRALSAMTADTSLRANKWDSIGGLRITDDGLILVAVNKYWADKNIVAANILNIFVDLFMLFTNRSLKMIFEKYAKRYEFLENVIMHHKDKVYVRFHVKNFESIRTNGHQKVKKGAARLSATSSQIKISTLMATFLRIRAGSTFDVFCKCDALKFIYEVECAYDWPRTWVLAALYKTANHRSQVEGVWAQVIHFFEEMKRKGIHWLLSEIDMMDEEINAKRFGT